MANTTEKLLNFLCVEWGFCLDPETTNILKSTHSMQAEEFACTVLKAEGMDSEMEIEWKRKIRNKFIEHFGSETNG